MPPSVLVEGVDFGPAPVTLPASQTNRLLNRGDILVEKFSNTSGPRSGIYYNDDGSLTLTKEGTFIIHKSPNSESESKKTIRTAQYLCGIGGILLLYVAFNMDKAHNSLVGNFKDFFINFASDILAIASILLVAELIERVRQGNRRVNYAFQARRYAGGVGNIVGSVGNSVGGGGGANGVGDEDELLTSPASPPGQQQQSSLTPNALPIYVNPQHVVSNASARMVGVSVTAAPRSPLRRRLEAASHTSDPSSANNTSFPMVTIGAAQQQAGSSGGTLLSSVVNRNANTNAGANSGAGTGIAVVSDASSRDSPTIYSRPFTFAGGIE